MENEKKHVHLQKRGRTVASYTSAFEAADDATTLNSCFGPKAKVVKTALRRNAFCLAIRGSKMTCGGGWRYICAE